MWGSWVSLALVVVVALIVVVAGIKRSAIGELIAFLLVMAATWWRAGSLAPLGLVRPDRWGRTLAIGLVAGIVLALASTLLIEPLAEKLTGEKHDFSAYDSLRGNVSLLLKWMPIVWIWVALIEEVIFRGFILKELVLLGGGGKASVVIGLVISSVIFGLPHAYQGKSGVISTAIVGFLLGALFVWGGYNLWLVILAHGVTDTVGLAMICAGADRFLRERSPF